MTERAAKVCPQCGTEWRWTICPACGTDAAHPAAVQRQDLVLRITNYLSSGGLWNPELMEHDKVRDLLLDCRTAFAHEPCVSGGPSSAPASERDPRLCPHGTWRAECLDCLDGGYPDEQRVSPDTSHAPPEPPTAAAPQAAKVAPLPKYALAELIVRYAKEIIADVRDEADWSVHVQLAHFARDHADLLQAGVSSVAQAERSDEARDARAHEKWNDGGYAGQLEELCNDNTGTNSDRGQQGMQCSGEGERNFPSVPGRQISEDSQAGGVCNGDGLRQAADRSEGDGRVSVAAQPAQDVDADLIAKLHAWRGRLPREKREPYTDDLIAEAADTLAALQSQVASLTAERDAAFTHVESFAIMLKERDATITRLQESHTKAWNASVADGKRAEAAEAKAEAQQGEIERLRGLLREIRANHNVARTNAMQDRIDAVLWQGEKK